MTAVRARILITVAVVASVGIAIAVTTGPGDDPEPTGRTWWVSAEAGADGDGSPSRPFAAIEPALASAGPGDRVVVGAGSYGAFATVRSGRPDAPIHLIGEGARIEGRGVGRVVEILHSYVTIENFEISQGDVLVRIVGASGTRLVANRLHDADSECVRLRGGASDNELVGNQIERCGLRDFDLDADRKNGEGIYVGVAPEQLEEQAIADRSDRNWIHGNRFDVVAECVDIKEGARQNRVEDNDCTGGQDPEGAGFSSRGDETIFRGNVSTGHVGAGIRLGGDEEDQGVRNEVVGNELTDTGGYAVKVERFPQGLICGNEVGGNDAGLTNGDVDPSQPCPSGAAPR
ncbi:MAG: right-handed parallel beta-helix repeat-containing protein [Actinobacteria bacterium]|nr:right-handed parallel beta-helix repeat-containing protein [Actinomycetota bacterium]